MRFASKSCGFEGRHVLRDSRFFQKVIKKARLRYKGAHKTVILKITIMTSVRQGWQRNNGYLVKAGYPLFFCRHEKQ